MTEYNTAHNRRISMLGINDDVKMKKNKNNKRKRRNVTFNDEECIINPEDIDPNVGRFRNLIQTTIVPTKRSRIDNNFMGYSTTTTATTAITASDSKQMSATSFLPHLYQDLPPLSGYNQTNKIGGKSEDEMNVTAGAHGQHNVDLGISTSMIPSFGSKLGLLLPNPAPDVTPNTDETHSMSMTTTTTTTTTPAFNVVSQSKPKMFRDAIVNNSYNEIDIFFYFPSHYLLQIKLATTIWIYRIQTNRERRNMQKKLGPDENHC